MIIRPWSLNLSVSVVIITCWNIQNQYSLLKLFRLVFLVTNMMSPPPLKTNFQQIFDLSDVNSNPWQDYLPVTSILTWFPHKFFPCLVSTRLLSLSGLHTNSVHICFSPILSLSGCQWLPTLSGFLLFLSGFPTTLVLVCYSSFYVLVWAFLPILFLCGFPNNSVLVWFSSFSVLVWFSSFSALVWFSLNSFLVWFSNSVCYCLFFLFFLCLVSPPILAMYSFPNNFALVWFSKKCRHCIVFLTNSVLFWFASQFCPCMVHPYNFVWCFIPIRILPGLPNQLFPCETLLEWI